MKLAARLALICLPALLAGLSHGQEPMRVPFGQDIHALRVLLMQQGLETLRTLEELNEDPKHSVLIVLGDTTPLDQEPKLFRDFVERGGAVLIASDRNSARVIESVLWIVTHDVVVSTNEEAHAYKRTYAQCPVIPTAGPERCVNSDHPVFRGLAGKGIATNRPGFVGQPGDTPRVLHPTFIARFPASCKVEPHRMLVKPLTVERLDFAAECNYHRGGPVLVLADHSVFINSMMLQEDNDNLQFAYNCIDWLTEHGQRKRVLVLDEGKAVTSLDVKQIDVPKLPPHPVEMVNTLLRGLQDHDPGQPSSLNKAMAEMVGPARIKASAAILVTLLLVVYGFFRLAQARQQP